MATYSEKTGMTLLDGVASSVTLAPGTSLSLREVDGSIVTAWPHRVTLTIGEALVFQDGSVAYDDGGDTANHPAGGETASAGSFSFRVWDGTSTSPLYTATISLTGTIQSVAPAFSVMPQITPASGPVGTTFTLDEGVVSGQPAPTLSGVLRLDGTDVTGQVAGQSYTSDAAGTLDWTVTATNGATSDAVASATATVAAATSATGGINSAGWDPAYDAGTAGDYFVAPSGSDSNPGTLASPFKTINRALTQLASDHGSVGARAGKVIRLRGGNYNEAVTWAGRGGTSAGRVTLARYGTERAVITGGKAATGWTQCTSADQGVVGSNWGSIWKLTVPDSEFQWAMPGTGMPKAAGANLCENNSPLYLATDRAVMDADKLRFQTTASYFHVADSVTASTVTDASVVSKYTATQLADTIVRGKVANNIVEAFPVTGTSGNTITFNGNASGDWTQGYWALANILPNMTQGSWGYRLSGGNVTLYVWPNDPASIASGKITYATIPALMTVNDNWVNLEGLDFVQPGGLGSDGPVCIEVSHGGAVQALEGFRARHVRCAHVDGSTASQRRKIFNGLFVKNFDVRYFTTEDTLAAYGFGIDNGETVRLFFHKARDLGQAPNRNLGGQDWIVAWCDYENVSLGQHANVFNMYGGSGNAGSVLPYVYMSDRVWVHGMRVRNANGYTVHKETRRIAFTCCDLGASILDGNEGALIVDGGTSRITPTGNPAQNPVIYQNLALRPDPQNLGKEVFGLNMGSASEIGQGITNSVIHGGGGYTAGFLSSYRECDYNLYTQRAWYQGAGTPYDPGQLGANNQVETSLAAVYADHLNRDYRPTSTVSKLATAAGRSRAAERAELVGWFSEAEVAAVFDLDILGQPMPLTAGVPIGPYADPMQAIG